MARPGKYEQRPEHYNQMAKQYAREGLINPEIAGKLGIATSTLIDWQKKHPGFSVALKGGKEYADSLVEDSLLKRALGYEYKELTFERTTTLVVDEDGAVRDEPGTKVKTVVKQLAPDPTSMIFWLKNRQPDKWRDKKEIEGNLTVTKLEDFV